MSARSSKDDFGRSPRIGNTTQLWCEYLQQLNNIVKSRLILRASPGAGRRESDNGLLDGYTIRSGTMTVYTDVMISTCWRRKQREA